MASQQPRAISDPERIFEGFENLMPFQVHDILLVSSLYDSFILREDGRLNELMIGESLELNLAHVPGITHVSSGAEALAALRTHTHINLVVTNAHVGDMDAAQLAAEVRRMGLDTPIVVLAYDQREITRLLVRHPKAAIEKAFLWQGNARILVAIVNHVEDRRNALHDTRAMGVPVILVVENDVRYYSSFLPEIYTAIITQTRSLISEGFNLAHKLVRMRARPKILLASTYEEAELIVDLHRDYLFGVISDVEFPHRGALNADAGFELAHMVRQAVPDVPIVLHSHRSQFAFRAQAEGFIFIEKRSDTLLNDLRKLLTDQFAFGDFIFRLPNGQEVTRACDLNELTQGLRTIPAESLVYHSERNHFSHWLMARTEFAVAQRLRPRKVSDFPSPEHLRRDVIASIEDYRQQQNQVLVGDFQPSTFKPSPDFFLRLGSGSLGGKARGLAFVRYLLHKSGVSKRFPGVRIAVPPTLVIATDFFDLFLQENNLLSFALHCNDDDQVLHRFLDAKLPPLLEECLLAFLTQIRYPLAIRSSSLLEDSHYQPFTGVYDTFMLANQGDDLDFRLEQAMEAIKRVYASTFTQHAKSYMRATPYRLEEEKMAVILQQVVGSEHADRYYPDFSGVARSWNFYPVAPMTSADGIATVALGLGRAVVEGGKALTFCPRAPRQLIQFTSVDDILKNAQSEFWALELNNDHHVTGENALRETRFGVDIAEQDGTLHLVGSTYSADNNAVYDGLSRKGVRIVSFAPVLKHNLFPLPAVVDCLQKLGEESLGRPVEIEFAVRVSDEPTEPSGFGFLQMRPLVLSRESEEVDIDSVSSDQVICRSSRVLGNGRYTDIRDLIVVDYHRFERGRSQLVAQEITRLNSKLLDQGNPYLLIGVGRWGSNDPWLGIPVTWDQIAGAKVIVEAGFRDLRVTPSQGSHFFQNLTAFQVGYFTVNPDIGEGFIDWEWLNAQPASEERDCVRHLRFASPLKVLIDGKQSVGAIGRPGR
ncbi:MAG TPA: PEP/pyruvate-binding domain-containing protein [Gemmatimonadaceae bacterium]|nr:PEP/pyruvate-binding domain-containing protein [Gemmatimonadaceae bacterium]